MTTILIDSHQGASHQAHLFQDPYQIAIARNASEVPQALQQIEQAIQQGHYAAGFFSYELGYLMENRLEQRLPADLKTPLIWFGLFHHMSRLDHLSVTHFLEQDTNFHGQEEGDGDYQFSNFSYDWSREEYTTAFNAAQSKIAAGDIYQINLTFQTRFNFQGNPRALYRDLKFKQQMKYGALIEDEQFTIISASPELFLSVSGRQALTVPMKGTAKRGRTLAEDQQIKSDLKKDQKSQAENLMIVDLMRNDLSRISELGSVSVSDLYAIETYPTLHQMVSNVESVLKTETQLTDWLKAIYPPGSITGAPKLRAMELISDLETSERGVYTGTIGMFLPEKEQISQTLFNVAIRTVTLWPDGAGSMGIGSGVVSDSDADAEYDECKLKMKFLTDPVADFQLIETYAFAPDQGYLYYQHHLNRLKNSSQYFDYTFDQKAIEEALEQKKQEIGSAHHRVRLLLSKDGSLSITATPVDAPDPDKMMRFVISENRTNRDNIYLYHKTTNRDFYDNEHAERTEDGSCDEVMFLNEQDELTEGSRTNIFLKKGGKLLTPAIECGLLAGTLRAELLSTGEAEEAILNRQDLYEADELYLGNSVRGLLKAVLVQ